MTSILVWGLVLSAPLSYYRVPLGPFNLTLLRLFLLPVLLLLAFRWLLAARFLVSARQARPLEGQGARTRRQTLRVFYIVAAMYFAFSVFQTLRSEYTIASRAMLTQTEGCLIVLALAAYATTRRRLSSLVAVYILSAVLPLTIAAYQILWYLRFGVIPSLPLSVPFAAYLTEYDTLHATGIFLHNIAGRNVFPRTASTMVDPNFFAIFLVSVTLVAATRFLADTHPTRYRKWKRFGILVVLLACVPTTVFTMSRSAWGGFVVGLTYIVLVLSKPRAMGTRSVRFSTLVFGVGIVGALLLSIPNWNISEVIGDRLGESSQALEGREARFSSGWQAFAENPLFGIGRANLILYTDHPTSHSFYTTTAQEYGVVGLFLAMSCLFLLWRSSIVRSGDSSLAATFSSAVGLRGALLALLTANLLYDHLLSLEVNWVLIGLLVATARRSIAPAAETLRRHAHVEGFPSAASTFRQA